jgi:phosphoribosyl-ATP pyrophosphohydrolase
MAEQTFTLDALSRRIAERALTSPEESWTAKLIAAGIGRAARKLGEEAVETVLAAVSESEAELTKEAADLIYHLLVVLHVRGIPLARVMAELESRTRLSGIAEKASRKG